MIVRGAGVLCAIIAARRVGGWSGFLLRTLLGFGFGSFISAAGSATCSGYGASRAVPGIYGDRRQDLLLGLCQWFPVNGLGPLLQAALAAGVAAGRLYGGQIDIPVLIKNIVPSQKLHKLAGGRAR